MTDSLPLSRPMRLLCISLLLVLCLGGVGDVVAQGPEPAAAAGGPNSPPPARVITPPEAGRSAGTPAGGRTLGSTVLSLALVLGLMLLTLVLLRRSAPNLRGVASTGAIQVLERQSLDARTQVYLVRCVDRILVLGVSPNGVTTLATLDATAEQLAPIEQAETDPAELSRATTLPWPWVSKALAAMGGRAA